MKKSLFLDFDGVLFNTLKEAYLLCRHSFSGIDYFKEIDETEYKNFYKYKFLVYNSWQYFYIMKLLDKGLSDTEFISKYEEFMKNRDYKSEKVFDTGYYSARKDLMNNHHDFWDGLEEPFPFFERIKRDYDNGLISPVIVSKKNKDSIEYRLKKHGLNLKQDKIFGRDELLNYETKGDFIREYMIKNKIETSFFIDDNSNNLKTCVNYNNIHPLLAGWGNISIYETGLTPDEITKTIYG